MKTHLRDLETSVVPISPLAARASSSGLPGSGFYPEISGIFRAVGIFLGNFFWGKNLGKIVGIFRE